MIDRLAAWADDLSATAGRVASSHLLTLVSPESLEQRAVMDVAAGLAADGTLGIWMDDANLNATAYVRQLGDGAGAILQVSSVADFTTVDVWEGPVPSAVQAYSGANVTLSFTSGGSGYTSAPTMSASLATFGAAVLGTGTPYQTTLSITGVSSTAGFALQDGIYTRSVVGGGGSGASVEITVTGSVVTGVTVLSGGSGYGTLGTTPRLNAALPQLGTGGAQPTFTFTGSVESFAPSAGTGYYALPAVTFSGGGGSGASAAATLAAGQTWLLTGFVTDSQSSQLSPDFIVGASSLGSVETVLLAAGTTGGIAVSNANDITLQGDITAPTKALSLALRPLATGNIQIGSSANVASISINAGTQDFTASGGALNAGIGSATITASNVTIETVLTGNTSLSIQATNDLTLNSTAATGPSSAAWMLLQATSGNLFLNGNATSPAGTVTVSAPNIGTSVGIAGPGVITGRALSIREGGASGNFALNANVSSVSGNVASNLTFTNARDLTIGNGAFTLAGNATSMLVRTTDSANLNVSGNIVMTNGGVLSLEAANSATITGTILPLGGNSADVTITAVKGGINAASSLNLGANGTLSLVAAADIKAPNVNVANLSVRTANGTANVTSTKTVSLRSATVGAIGTPGVGNLTLTTLQGDILVDGEVNSFSTGTVTLQANNGNVRINESVFVNTTSGSLVINAAKGEVTNAGAGAINTSNLTWIARTGNVALLNTPAISSFSRISANITGAGNDLVVVADRPLSVGSIVTTGSGSGATANKAGNVSITADVAHPDRADLVFNGTIDAGNRALNTLANVTLSAPNGSVTSTGSVAANVLTLNANYASSITNQSVNQLNATITGPGENLAVVSNRDLTAGNINLVNAVLDLKITTGNLTRSGAIDTGATGTAMLTVANGTILGSGRITADSLQFVALATPDLSPANATFTRLSANVTRAGNITLTRASSLVIDQATTTLGSITLNVDSATLPADLTINGPLVAGGNGNVTLNVPNGAISFTPNAASNITANVLNVSSKQDLSLNTNVATLVANVVGGSLTVTEANGLAIGVGNVIAANDVTINVLDGNLARNGRINASNTTGTITLNVANGSITGAGGIDTASLVLRSKGSVAIGGAANVVFSNVSANVTGANASVVIDRTGSYNVHGVTTADGLISLGSASGSLSIVGDLTAGNGKSVTLNAATGSVTVNAPAVVTGGSLNVTAQSDSTLRTNVANLTATVASGDLTVTAVNGLVGSITANSLNVTANGTSNLVTNVTNLSANVSNGGLTVVDPDDLFIEPADVVAAGTISITSTAGNIAAGAAGSGINAGTANVTLVAPFGTITFANTSGQVVGDVLTLNAAGDTTVNTAVNAVVANLTIGSLTVNEVNDLVVGSGSGNVTALANITINLAGGSLSGSGLIRAGGNVSLSTASGGITLNSAVGQVAGSLLTVNASRAVNVNTAITTGVAANVTDVAQGFSLTQDGILTINGANITTNSGDIAIAASGGIARTGKIDAGSANVSLTTASGITGTGLIAANVLTFDAASTSALNTAVNAVEGRLTANLAALTVDESDSLDIGSGGITTANGSIGITAAGAVGGTGTLNAGATGNLSLNSTAGGVTLPGSGQVRGNLLTVNATAASNLGTSVASLAADVGAADLTVTDTDGLNIASGNVSAGNVTLVAGAVAAGNLGGSGLVNASTNVVLNAGNGAVNLTSKTGQVNADNLVVTAKLDSAVNTGVANLSGTIASGGLTIEETDGLRIAPTDVTTAGPLSINVAAGSLSGAAGAALNAGTAAVNLNASNGGITLNATAGQVKGGLLTLVSKTSSNVSTDVATLVANVTAGGLAVSETDGLAIGTSNTSVVRASGDIQLVLANGNLSGPGVVNAASNAVSIQILGQGNVQLAGMANRIVADRLDVATSNGSINVATAVNTVTAAASLSGNIAVSQSQSLTINQILAVSGDVNVALSAGNLTVDSNSILGGQLSNVTLNAALGSVRTVNTGVVFGNVLDVRAQNASSLNTSVSALKANMSPGANLSINESDTSNASLNISPNGLAIASDVILRDGTLTLNLANGNLTGTGNINVGTSGTAILNVAAGAATLNGPSQVTGGELRVSVVNTSTLGTNVATLNGSVVTGLGQSLTINEANDLNIGVGNLIASGGGNLTVTLGGNLSGPGNIVANGAGGLGNVALNSTSGGITLTGAKQVVGNQVSVAAVGSAALNTNATSLTGNITGAGNGLVVVERDNLVVAGAGIRTNNGSVSLTAGRSLSIYGNLSLVGAVNAGTANVALDAYGSIGGTGVVSGNVLTATMLLTSDIRTNVNSIQGTVNGASQVLTIRETDGLSASNVTAGGLNLIAGGPVSITTNVATLTANVTNGSLTVVEHDNLAIDPAGVTATGIGITVGAVTAAGNLSGSGLLNARTGNVNLSAANGAVTLNAPGQVAGNVLTLVARNASTLNTSVSTLNANITGASQALTVTETDSLTIGTTNGVVSNGGLITIRTLAGDLVRNGQINATGSGNVVLNINGATSGNGLVTANVLSVTVANTSSINTAVNTISSQVTNPNATLSIFETDGLNINGASVGGNGTSVISVASGVLNISGNIDAPNASLSLIAANGTINATGSIYLNQLALVAANVTPLNTRLNGLSANITGAGNQLVIVERDNLVLFGNGATTSNGNITIRTGNTTFGCLTLNAPVNAGSANVALTANGAINGSGLVTGNVLTANVLLSSTISTNINAIAGGISGASQNLTINELNGLQVGAANLVASGSSAGVVLNVANGALNGAGSITTSNGTIRLITGNGPMNMTGGINAGVSGGVVLTANGAITLTGANQVSANQVTVSSVGSAALNTAATSLTANITGAGNGLVVVERDNLVVGGAGIRTNNGSVSLTAGRSPSIYGNLSLAGAVNAGVANVALNSYGSISGIGVVSANVLTANVLLTSDISTNVAAVQGVINGASQVLTINEQNGLQIGAANLSATGGSGGITVNVAAGAFNGAGSVVSNNGAISVVVGNGPLNMTGVLNAGVRGNVRLNVAGAVTMTAANQIVADQLTIAASGPTTVSTAIAGLSAKITGNGSGLSVTDADALTIAANGVMSANGDISITSGRASTGRLFLGGPVNAGTANVTLVANGVLDGTGLVSGNVLSVNGSSTTTLRTDVNALAANTGGSLIVTESSGLSIAAAGVRSTSGVSITLAAGNLVGTGGITATNVSLTTVAGGINLTAAAGQVSAGNLLSVSSNGAAALNTNVANLTATVANGPLTVRELNDLQLASDGINTASGNGQAALTLLAGNLSGPGRINAGNGNVVINAAAGNVTLNATGNATLNASAWQVAGNVLTMMTRGSAAVSTSISSLNATVTATGDLTVNEANNLAVINARTTNGAVTITSTNASTLEVYSITAATGSTGNVTLAAGNVVVYTPGITASGTLDISGVGNMGVNSGGITANTVVNQSNGNGVNWLITNPGSTGEGSLNAAITNANKFNGKSQIGVTQNTTVTLTSPLPAITKTVTLAGNGLLTIDGAAAGPAASGLTVSGTGVVISGVTLRNFGGAGIDLMSGATNTQITKVTVLNSAIGIRAVGVLTGSVVSASTFDGQNRSDSTGALLAAAQGLTLGLNNNAEVRNTFRNASIGMTASGASGNTRIQGNSFENLVRFGISLAAATNLQIGDPADDPTLTNTVSGMPVGSGVFASGFCTGSSVNYVTFVGVTTMYDVSQSRNLTIRIRT
jgi:hypothetical protein